MRPLKLKITGFGTYSQPTVIDFEKFGTQGLYLITGDTGSGKTTIFDAICFALFGTASGKNREVKMLRSSFAGPETPTEVELTFSNKDKVYVVKRNPEYERLAKRGEGVTKEAAGAELTYPDGKVVTKQNDVNEAVQNILGIDRDQFTQISMIAQGDFQHLLMEESKDRQAIFRKIFKTERFQKMQEKLNDEEKALKGSIKEKEAILNSYMDSTVCSVDNVLSLELEKAKSQNMSWSEKIAVVEKIAAEDQLLQDNLNKKQEKNQNQLDEINALFAKAEGVVKAKQEKDAAIVQKTQAQEGEAKAKAAYDEEKARAPEIEKLQQNYILLESFIPKYDQYDLLKAGLEEKKGERSAIQLSLEEKEAEAASLEKAVTELSEEAKTLENAAEKLARLESQKTIIDNRSTQVDELEKDVLQLENSKKELKKAQIKYEQSYAAAEKAEAEYKSLNKAFMDEQAGILAETLKDNCPCPVCGSLSHPSPAQKSLIVPTEAELKAAETAAKNAADKVTEDHAEAAALNGNFNSQLTAVEKNFTALFNHSFECKAEEENTEQAKKCLTEEKSSLKNQSLELAKQIKEEKVKKQRKLTLDELIPQKQKALLLLKEELTEQKEKSAALTAEIGAAEENCAKMKKELQYSDKKEAEEELKKLSDTIRQAKAAVEKAEENYREAQQSLLALTVKIEELEKQIKDGPVFDKEAEEKKRQELLTEKSELAEKLKEVNNRLSRNNQALENIVPQSGELIKLEEKALYVTSLSKTAGGTIGNGKSKVMLETYVQMTYFDRMIQYANKRLQIMTDGQYSLVRDTDVNVQSQSGLDLKVIDHYMGGPRSVKSLSGGESFEASLSLALGLSDEITASAGGIKIDTIFIDEGFGTLDTETLQKAYKALSSISEANKLVGIISHVDFLEEKIDKKIVVTKDIQKGSQVEIRI